MLVPAITKKAEIEQKFAEHIYDDDMFLFNGYPHCNTIHTIEPKENRYQWAIVDNDKLIGYFAYNIYAETDTACSFGLYSFDKGNPIIGLDVFKKMKELVNTHRRLEWRMVGGNPVQKHYDRFCEKYGGKRVCLHKVVKDNQGKYHDEFIYEVVRGVDR